MNEDREILMRPPRYADNGHRAPLSWGPSYLDPVETHKLPVWYWPFELIGRAEAKLLARHPISFWEKP
jgi:hypothetical protein